MRPIEELQDHAERSVEGALAAGADHAEAFIQEGRSLNWVCREGFTAPKASHSLGMALRVVVDGRPGQASSSGSGRIAELVDEACLAARQAPVDVAFAGFAAPATRSSDTPSATPEVFRDPDPARLEALGAAAMAALDQEACTYRAVTVASSRSRFAVANDTGHQAWDETSLEWMLLDTRAGEVGTQAQRTGMDLLAAREGLQMSEIERVGGALARRTADALQHKPLGRPVTDVVLAPQAAGQFVSMFLHPLSGRLVETGKGPFAGRLGEQVASPLLDIRDAPAGHRVRRFDHEGTPCDPLDLVTDGLLRNVLHDTRSGAAAGTGSNGRGLRAGGWSSGVGVAPVHPVVGGGDKSLEELIAAEDRAVLVTDPLAGFFSSNRTTGDFSVVAPFGFLIEKGEVVHALPHTTIGGNVHDLMRDLHGVGREQVEARSGTFTALSGGGVSCAA
ncbi:MAG: TldD/PmbA family protein [Thermoplasmatota archaeon]